MIQRFLQPSQSMSKDHHMMVYYECWSCGQPANHHCGPDNPQAGEVLICLNCTDPSIFDADGVPQAPGPEVHAGIIADPTYRSFVGIIRAANRRAIEQQAGEAHE